MSRSCGLSAFSDADLTRFGLSLFTGEAHTLLSSMEPRNRLRKSSEAPVQHASSLLLSAVLPDVLVDRDDCEVDGVSFVRFVVLVARDDCEVMVRAFVVVFAAVR